MANLNLCKNKTPICLIVSLSYGADIVQKSLETF